MSEFTIAGRRHHRASPISLRGPHAPKAVGPLFRRYGHSLRALSVIAAMGVAACAGPHAPPGGDYKKVSELVRFPDFYPGLGTLYVQPKTLPVGPFRAYDRDGNLASTI